MSFLAPGGSLGAVSDGDFAHDCGWMECVCPHCGALYWHLETTGDGVYTRCCSRGDVSVPLPPIPGAEFRELFEDPDFRKNIRAINNLFAMASSVCTDDTYTVRDVNGCVCKCPFASTRVTGTIKTMINSNISTMVQHIAVASVDLPKCKSTFACLCHASAPMSVRMHLLRPAR